MFLGCKRIAGRSSAAAQLRKAIKLYAVADGTILIEGETGSGKEQVARAIHEESGRARAAFSSVDCGVLADALFESELFGHERGAFTGAVDSRRGLVAAASGGTLFLDEIENLGLQQQAKLLRLVQDHEFRALGSERVRHVDIRLVVATNLNLADLVHQGLFRTDLFYRLDVLRISVPPLRDRLEDLPELLGLLAARSAGRDDSVAPPAADQLAHLRMRAWPGNVRELGNVAERAAALAGAVGWAEAWSVAITDHRTLQNILPDRFLEQASSDQSSIAREANGESDNLRRVLDRHHWRREEAARDLGISRVTLWRRMRRCGLAG